MNNDCWYAKILLINSEEVIMKKSLKLLFVGLLLFGMTLTGCSQSSNSGNNTPIVEADDKYEIYELYKASGGTMNYEEWLESIKGADGSSLLTGTTNPDSPTGNNGDTYINTTTWDVFVKSSGNWVKVGNIMGPQGPQGPQGEPGEDGQDGKSAYELYCESHPEYNGTEEEWLDDLVNGRLGNQQIHIVSFDSCGGSEVPSQQVLHGEKVAKPINPIRNGHNFVDWVDENNDHWVFNGFSITKDITLYAIWSDPIDYNVKFVNDNGSVLYETTAHYGETVSYPYNDPISSVQEDNYIYKFVGWDKDLLITSDVIIYAKYEKTFVSYGVKYLDENDNVLYEKAVSEGDSESYVGTTPTKETDEDLQLEYQFNSWKLIDYSNGIKTYKPVFDKKTIGLELTTYSYHNVVSSYSGTSLSVVIPSKWDGKKVDTIGTQAFKGQPIKNIEFPDSMYEIGLSSFRDCISLSSIDIPDSVRVIESGAFSGCSALVSIKLPCNLTSISSCIFSQCSKLKSIDIPEGVETIENNAFDLCTNLSNVNFPSTLVSIESRAFVNCSNLIKINIPEGVRSIESSAFSQCGLSFASLPSTLRSIPNNCFASCSSLSSVVVSKDLIAIGNQSFWNCPLKRIFVFGESLDWNELTIGDKNEAFNKSNAYYYSEEEPIEAGQYWHFVDGTPYLW